MATRKFNVMQSADSNKSVAIYYVAGDVAASEINEAVYAAFCQVGEAVLYCSTCLISGEQKASELAGKVCKYLDVVQDNDGFPKEITIKAGTYQCHFETKDFFAMMAEWEGMMELKAKDVHTFACECKPEHRYANIDLKSYKRHRYYKPSTISLVDENKRIAKKFEVLTELYNSLTSEGMRRAMSVLKAMQMWNNCKWELRFMAENALLRKFWKDYGKKGCEPIAYGKSDFQNAPEIWKRVDEKYVAELVTYFQTMLSSVQKPSWPAKDDVVQFRDKDKLPKKYHGKYLVEDVAMSLNNTYDRIEWVAMVRTKKYYCESFFPCQLEPAEEKPKKVAKPKVRAATAAIISQQTEQVNAEPSMADKLRAVLLARLAA